MSGLFKTVILNDTSIENHHGCRMVIEQIKYYCNKYDLEIIHYVKVHEDWRLSPHLKYIKQADVVIVNGEGTMHSSKPSAHILASVAPFCKENNIKSSLINSVYQNNEKSINKLIDHFDRIYVRESRSKSFLDSTKSKSEVVPDLIFSMNYPFKKKNNSNSVIFTDSVLLEVTEKLFYKSNLFENSVFLTMRASANDPLINFSDKTEKMNLKKLIKSLLKIGKQNNSSRIKRNIDYNKNILNNYLDKIEFLKTIERSSFIVTGRFHMVCLAILSETPFMTFPSNTHKTEGLLHDVGLSKRLIDVSEIDKINQSYFEKFKYSHEELKRVKDYTTNAKLTIDNMFKEISEEVKFIE